ncbi:MAG: hypothetical protein HUU18_00655 [Phycisphaerales bacterium]|jgi:hypothetical protein|nr:hypothetical protein [Phycisphaerales bacterium]
MSARTLQTRRAASIAALIIALALINLAVMGSVAASADEAELGAMRAQTLRAFYAAESGGLAIAKLRTENLALPSPGTIVNLPSSSFTFVSLPPATGTGQAVIEGRSDAASRRLRLTLADD